MQIVEMAAHKPRLPTEIEPGAFMLAHEEAAHRCVNVEEGSGVVFHYRQLSGSRR